jgi:L-rhamnose mutarotase
MERIAFHLTIREGKREAYREAHQGVPEALEAAYLDAGAGLSAYSVFEVDGHVFGYMAVENPERVREVIDTSDAQAAWDEEMAPVLEEPEDGIWMDEVYRMV